jgi:hypothetical protein
MLPSDMLVMSKFLDYIYHASNLRCRCLAFDDAFKVKKEQVHPGLGTRFQLRPRLVAGDFIHVLLANGTLRPFLQCFINVHQKSQHSKTPVQGLCSILRAFANKFTQTQLHSVQVNRKVEGRKITNVFCHSSSI